MKRVPQLDGLRGIAILLVLVCHYVGLQNLHSYWGMLAYCGWCGVDLFFVLSGFLIGGILLDNRLSINYYQVFYARRILRIAPVFIVAVLSVALLATHSLQFPLWSHLTFTQDIFVAISQESGSNNSSTPILLGAIWSLAVEEKFYLVIAPMVRLYSRNLFRIATVIILASPAIRAMEFALGGGDYSRMLPFGRLDSLTIGVALALFARKSSNSREIIRKHALPVAMICAALLPIFWCYSMVVDEMWFSAFGYSLLAFIFGGVVIHVATFPEQWKWLTFTPLVYCGVYSYAIYLIHSPIYYAVSSFTSSYPLRLTLSTVVTFAIAALSWTSFEKHLIALGQSMRYCKDESLRLHALRTEKVSPKRRTIQTKMLAKSNRCRS